MSGGAELLAGPPLPAARSIARRGWILRALRRDRTTVWAGLILAVVVGASLALPEVLPYRYDQQSLDHTFEGPSARHWLGTDQYGRDLLTRLAHGGRISLLVGAITVLAEIFLGGCLGGIAGYAGGVLDEWLMRLTDMMLAFPALLLALLLAAILGPGTTTVIVALTLAGWPAMARTVRGEILSLKEREFVVAARAQGASAVRILVAHLLRNAVHLIVVRATLDIGPIILTEATLSFLGLGVQRPMPSWGVLIADSFQYLQTAPALAVIPCAALSTTILALNFVGEGAAEAMDPSLRAAP
ncbi:MAG TPA: ABC transporter permease [Methylomirabilota bacterium]|jgi:ABC-type dipeptide/oligopeptide/nickel transport system permease subunit|nr:ABC transporter permease [Methylomirabilota bacterium]